MSSHQILCVAAKPGHDHGVEALNADLSPVIGQELIGFFAQLPVSFAVFQLHDQRPSAPDGVQNLGKQRDRMLRAAEPELFQLLIAQLIHPGVYAADPLQRVVVKDHHLSVFGELDVQLYAVARLCSQFKGLQGVFRDAFIPAVQAPVGKVHAHKGGFLPSCGPARGQQDQRQTDCCGGAEQAALHSAFFLDTHKTHLNSLTENICIYFTTIPKIVMNRLEIHNQTAPQPFGTRSVKALILLSRRNPAPQAPWRWGPFWP